MRYFCLHALITQIELTVLSNLPELIYNNCDVCVYVCGTFAYDVSVDIFRHTYFLFLANRLIHLMDLHATTHIKTEAVIERLDMNYNHDISYQLAYKLVPFYKQNFIGIKGESKWISNWIKLWKNNIGIYKIIWSRVYVIKKKKKDKIQNISNTYIYYLPTKYKYIYSNLFYLCILLFFISNSFY